MAEKECLKIDKKYLTMKQLSFKHIREQDKEWNRIVCLLH